MPRRKTASKRTKGTGSLFERPKGSGKWYIRPPDTDGTQHPERRAAGTTRVDVEAELAELLRFAERGGRVDAKDYTFGQWLDHWLESVIAANTDKRKRTTYESYAEIVRLYITPHLGTIKLRALRATHIRTWITTLRKTNGQRTGKPLSASTIGNAFTRLDAALNVATRDKLIPDNPAHAVRDDLPSIPQSSGTALTPAQANKLLTAVGDHWLAALYYIAVTTGLRQGELLGLRSTNLVLLGDDPRIKVREQLQQVDKRLQFITPKSKQSVRDIPLDPITVQVLRAHLDQVDAQRERLGDDWKEHLLVFPSQIGTPINPRNLLRHFGTVCTAAGIPHLRFHDLRHTAGSMMLASGTPITDVSKVLGHSSVNVTAKIYAHSYDDNKRRAVASVTAQLETVKVAR